MSRKLFPSGISLLTGSLRAPVLHKWGTCCLNIDQTSPDDLKQPDRLASTLSKVCLRRPDDMVVAAIISLQDPVGSHPDDIMHWIQVLCPSSTACHLTAAVTMVLNKLHLSW